MIADLLVIKYRFITNRQSYRLFTDSHATLANPDSLLYQSKHRSRMCKPDVYTQYEFVTFDACPLVAVHTNFTLFTTVVHVNYLANLQLSTYTFKQLQNQPIT